MVPSVDKKSSSRIPESLPRQPKLKRLKQRLQMKTRSPDKPVDPLLEDDLHDAQHVATVVPPEKPVENQAPHEEQVGQGNKNQSGLFNRSSPMKIIRVCQGFTQDQCQVIVDAQLGDVLQWKVSKLIPGLCKFLMGCFKPDTCVLDFGARGRIPVDFQSVVRVLGVPLGTDPISYHMDTEATRVMLDMFGIKDGKQPSLAFLEKQLGPSHPADHIFLRKFYIYLACSVFAPTTAIGISPRCYPSFIHTECIRRLNWPKFIIEILIQTSRAKETKNWFKACMPYLLVLYVDSLQTDAVVVPEDGTRMCMWTNKMVRLVVDLDTNPDGSFGNLPLKPCFRVKTTLFSAGPSILDMFIRTHAPGDHTEDDLAKYRVAVTEMCTVFEDGLTQFLKNMSSTVSKAQVIEEEPHVVEQHTKRARGRRNKHTSIAAAQGVTGEGNNDAEGTDEVTAPVNLPKDTRKRGSNEESFPTDSARSKKAKSDHVQQTEPLEINEKDLQKTAEEKGLKHLAEEKDLDTFELDMEIATTRLKNSNVKNGSSGEEATVTDVNPGVAALKHLQIYGTGSQSSGDGSNTQEHIKSATKLPAVQNVSSVGAKTSAEATIQPVEPNCSPTTSKRVTCPPAQVSPSRRITRSMSPLKATIQPVEPNCSPTTSKRFTCPPAQVSPSCRITRSMSPLKSAEPTCKDSPKQKWDVGSSGNPVKSPRRQTRFATSKVRASWYIQNQAANQVDAQQGHSSPPLLKDSTSRKLDSEFGSTRSLPETEQQRRRRELINICPTFDLGFDDSPKEDVATEQQADGGEGELVVISSNESGDSLDKIYATIDMPATTPVIDKGQNLAGSTSSPSAPNSYTPVPQAHQKRLVKTAANQKSPYMQGGKKVAASKSTLEVYNKLCSYGGRTTDEINKEKIVDDGVWFIYVRDLADSIRPTGWLSNSTCEFALHVLSKEMAKQKKLVMPLNIATKLRSPTCIFDRVIQRAFEFSPKNRLDHKELIMFSVLQDLDAIKETSRQKNKDTKFTGHYYLIVLNLKAERFEVMDSMRKKGTPSLMSDAVHIIGAIKHLWGLNYSESKINISRWKTEFIETPMQKTNHDCGYLMLMFIEYWDGRRMVCAITPAELPTARKLLMQKWLDLQENLIAWHDLLFPN